jgi:glutamate dehydrogenase (NADP+)
VSGSGNVAQYAAQKAMRLGAKVVTFSDSNGFIHDPEGMDEEKINFVMELKNFRRGRIKEYVEKYPQATYYPDERPWRIPCDIALPCATQNEIEKADAENLVKNGCFCVAEGANMPSTPEAIRIFQSNGLLYSPGKASNAGGVATSGLEMSQNSMRQKWTAEEVDDALQRIMSDIHAACIKYGTEENGYINYVKGANIAGFIKVANAMVDQGLV